MMSMFLVYFIVVLFLFFTYKNKKPIKWNEVLQAITFSQRNDDIFRIPGPLRLPFVGSKWNSLFINMKKLHEYYADLHRQYGPVVLEIAGDVPIVSLFNKIDIDKVLKYPSKFPFRPPTTISMTYRKSRPDRYNLFGLVNEQGPSWAHLRSKLTPKTFENRKAIAEFCPDLNEIIDEFVILLKTRRNEDNVVEGVDNALKLLSFEGACCMVLGKRVGFLSDGKNKNEDLQEIMTSAKKMFEAIRDSYYGIGLWKYIPTKLYKKYAENEESLYDNVLNVVNQTTRDNQIQPTRSEKASILVSILQTEGLDDRDKISGVIDFLLAGIEVFSNTVSFLLYYFSMHPETIEKIYQETMHIGDVVTQEDLSRAYYTRAAIHETFRLSPTAFALARVLEEDLYLSDYLLKAGTVVLCQNMIACRNNDFFENASEFRPERWLSPEGEFSLSHIPGSSIVVPFGCGKRICPGRKYSELELMILVIKLTKNFKFTFKSEFEHQFEFVLAAKGPVNIQFCDR